LKIGCAEETENCKYKKTCIDDVVDDLLPHQGNWWKWNLLESVVYCKPLFQDDCVTNTRHRLMPRGTMIAKCGVSSSPKFDFDSQNNMALRGAFAASPSSANRPGDYGHYEVTSCSNTSGYTLNRTSRAQCEAKSNANCIALGGRGKLLH